MIREYPRNKNYLVSDDGKIYSKTKGKYLTPKINHDGYHRVQIWEDGKCRFVSWHRIIAETFLPNPNNYNVVNHIDGDKQNNHVKNLEWCTQEKNIQHACRTGLSTMENHSRCGAVIQYDFYGNMINEFPCASIASSETGINYFTIIKTCTKMHGARNKQGYYWRFKKL